MSFLPRDKLRCYVLVAFDPTETIEVAETRCREVWETGCIPFVQLYQPPGDKRVAYPRDWRDFARRWERPAIIKARMRVIEGVR